MASSFSSDLKLELVATGEKAGLWGTITNTNLQILEQSASGYLDLSLASGSVTLLLSDGAASNRTSSKYTLSVTTASGTAQPVPVGATLLCVSDGTNTVTRIIEKGYYTIDSSSITAYTAVAGDQLLINTTSNPATGDEVFILDARGTFAANNVTVGRNSQPIMSNGSDLTLSTSSQTVNLVYVDSTRGWAYRSSYL